MTYQEKVKRHLKSTGLYRLNGTSLVEAEMYAYAGVLEMISKEIQAMLKDCFIDELESPKGELFEDLFGLPATKFPLTEEKREERLHKIELMKQRLNTRNSDFSAAEIKKQLAAGGLDVTLAEDFANKVITVNVVNDRKYIDTIAEKQKFIKQVLPCHSTVTINFI